MSVINPLALFFAALAIPIILLYLLRLQRREQTVSSTLLWRQVVLDREANTLWQRLRRNLLLLLQLLTLAFLVFALVRPYLNLPSTLSGRLIVLLDGSASMQATDVAPTRFEAAKAEIRKLIDELGPSSDMTIILVDGSPHALASATSSKSELTAALDTAHPSLESANWSAGVALATAAGGGGGSDNSATTVILSDGINADDLQLLTGNVRYIPIGVSGDNVAISTLSLRKTPRGLAAFVRVTNTGSTDDRVLVSLRSDSVLLDARTLSIPAGQSVSWIINGIDPQVSSVRASIDQAAHNDLPIDDVAYVVNEKNTQRRVLLLTRGNRFLEQALAVLPNLQVTRAITAPEPADAKPYDLYVLDGISATLPSHASVLFIGAQSVFTASGVFSSTTFMRSEQHPVLASVDWRSVNALDIARVNTPEWLRPIAQSSSGPMLFAGEMRSQGDPFWRVVLIPFELRESDLPLQVAFPVLIANSVAWLAPPQGLNIPSSVKPGDVVPIPADAIVLLPDGNRVAVGQRGFAQTNQLGVYSAQYGDVAGAFAVNFSIPAESKIAPNLDLKIGGATPSSEVKPQYSQREIWSWLAVAALILLVIEWWVYQRGVPMLRRK
ncbi:MAG: VWA domain-containing protein [Chloroflexi bacterium]|nr:VWA domain-containing protein [Chloroflexota bacterium]MCL5273886.1 VWA domain-containing protein [Chloroflexota bacterium]